MPSSCFMIPGTYSDCMLYVQNALQQEWTNSHLRQIANQITHIAADTCLSTTVLQNTLPGILLAFSHSLRSLIEHSMPGV